MDRLKYDRYWNVLDQYNFDVSGVSSNIICLKCRKIAVEAYHTTCECHYCRRCINEYLGNEKRYCLGGKVECSDEYLTMNDNVVKDIVGQRKIINLTLKCPNQSCSYKTKLENMEEHIRMCTMRSMDCPFGVIGCTNDGILADNMNEHLSSELLEHSQYTMDAISNLKNDVKRLSKILDIKDSDGKMEVLILEMKKDINGIKDTIRSLEKKINGGILGLEKEIKSGDIATSSEKVCSIIKPNVEESMDTNIDTMKDKEKKKKVNNWITDLSNETKDFVWTINNFSQMNGWYDSQPFYKENYKLRLRIFIYDDEYLTLEVVIMNGEKDDLVTWPMTHTIIISIINQYKRQTYKYWKLNKNNYKDPSKFNRPKTYETNNIRCENLFIEDNPQLLLDDSLIVCCSLSL